MATSTVMTPTGTCSFITLEKPRAVVDGEEERYSITLIFDKVAQNSQAFKNLEKAIEDAKKERWPGKVPPNLHSPFRDGADKAGVYEGYHPGDIFIAPWSKSKPGCVDIQRLDVLDYSDYFAGWTARAIVRPFAYSKGGKQGVSLMLDSVQFLRPGKRLDGRKSAAESFPDDMNEDDPV